MRALCTVPAVGSGGQRPSAQACDPIVVDTSVVPPSDGGEVWRFVRFCYDVRGVSARTIEGDVSSAVKHAPREARPCVGGAAVVRVDGRCFSTPLSLPLILPALFLSLSRPESRVWALHVTCGPRTTRRRVLPALVVQGAPLSVGMSTPVRVVGMGCVHRAPAAPSCLAGAMGACDRVCECMCGWRPGTPHPSFLGPVLHATAHPCVGV